MSQDAPPKSGCQKSSCRCGGHGRHAAPRAPDAIPTIKLGAEAAHECGCKSNACPRRYLALTGFALGGFLTLHLATNALGLWPAKFQMAVNRDHSLGGALPVLEVGLIFLPLTIHVAFGLRTLYREKLKFGVEKHHHGSDLRQWLQRFTALILLTFIAVHVVTMHRWFGGRFDPHDAFISASQAIRQFWHGLPEGHPGNLLFADFYLLGIAAAVYHLANGVATGAEVLGFVDTLAAQQRLWRICLVAASVLLLAGLAAWYAFAWKYAPV
jgi:succinate dehydrogenase / fumarate reductase cytochrome b subunit